MKRRGWALAGLLLAAWLAPFAAPHDPARVHGEVALAPLSFHYPLGTDPLGRCLLSRILFAARTSATLALGVVALALVAGLAAGCAAAYWPRWDSIIRWWIDTTLAFPGTLVALVAAAIFGPGWLTIVFALAATTWTKYARVSRQIALSLRDAVFVDAARAIGAGPFHILRRHVAPILLPPIVELAALGAAQAILSGAALSFLGLGIPAPTPEWGSLIAAARPYTRAAPHLLLLPAAALLLFVYALQSLAGDRDAARD